MATATRLGRDLLSLSSSTSKTLRAATIRVRFADIIVKSKHMKLTEESSRSSADGLMRIKREKQLLERRLLQEKARIEAAKRRALRLENRKALEKMEQKADTENHLVTETELVNLCGGYRGARLAINRWWVKEFGLVLRTDDDYDDESLEKPETCDDLEEGEMICDDLEDGEIICDDLEDGEII